MGKQSRALNRAKAAAPVLPPSQTLSEEQMAELRAKHQRQQRFNGFVQKRPTPVYWQPVMQHLATLDKVADVRWTDDTLKTLIDDQVVHGLLSGNITVYKARDVATGSLLTQYSVKQAYPKPRWPIYPAGLQLQIEMNKQQHLERMRPLFNGEVLKHGRLNIPAYFAALEQIRMNDEAKAKALEEARSIGDGGKDIAARIAAGDVEFAEAEITTQYGEGVPAFIEQVLNETKLPNGLVQVETKKVEEVLVDPQDPVATGLALERQADVDATFEGAQLAAGGIKDAIEEGLKLSSEQ
jgi:hypothetical protein